MHVYSPSVKHIRRHAWPIFAKAQFKKRPLLHKVTSNMKPEPATFRINMTRKSFCDELRIN